MTMRKISKFVENDRVYQDLFRVLEYEVKITENSKSYLFLRLENPFNTIPGVYWKDPYSFVNQIAKGQLVEVSGKVESVGGSLALVVDEIFPSDKNCFDNFYTAPQQPIKDEVIKELDCNQKNNPDSKLVLTKSFIGYQDGIKYFPRTGLTKEILKTLAQVNKGRRKNGKLVVRTTLKNLVNILSEVDTKFNNERIRVAIYTIKDNPLIKKLPLRISVTGDELEILED